jgi:replication initiation and membrane attachment protein DnaB
MENIKLNSVINANFELNICNFMDYYAPVLNPKATLLYFALYNFAKKCKKVVINVKRLLFDAKVESISEFETVLSHLEGLNLIKTFRKNQNDTKFLTLLVNEPKRFNEFLNNHRYKELLINAVGIDGYCELEYLYLGNNIAPDFQDISKSFDVAFSAHEINKINTTAISSLCDAIVKKVGKIFTINTESMNIIKSFEKNYTITLEQFSLCVSNSLQQVDGMLTVSPHSLELSLQKIIDDCSYFGKPIRLYRDKNIFFNKSVTFESEAAQKVFACYNSVDAKSYLSTLVGRPLNNLEVTDIEN